MDTEKLPIREIIDVFSNWKYRHIGKRDIALKFHRDDIISELNKHYTYVVLCRDSFVERLNKVLKDELNKLVTFEEVFEIWKDLLDFLKKNGEITIYIIQFRGQFIYDKRGNRQQTLNSIRDKQYITIIK